MRNGDATKSGQRTQKIFGQLGEARLALLFHVFLGAGVEDLFHPLLGLLERLGRQSHLLQAHDDEHGDKGDDHTVFHHSIAAPPTA
jgi:hypothetical protein